MLSRRPHDSTWRDHLLEAVAGESQKSRTRDILMHGLRVEQAVLRLLDEPEYRAMEQEDQVTLVAASLLHGVVQGMGLEPWSADCEAKAEPSLARLRKRLVTNEAFRGSPDRVQQALYLIKHLDGTTYTFPFKGRRGRPAARQPAPEQRGVCSELALLREADALVHVEEGEIGGAIQTWTERGVPYFAEHGPAQNSWMWHDCVAGNIRLVAKRAVLDAKTRSGRQQALHAYDRLEGMIRGQCERRGVSYQPEISRPEFREASVERMAHRSFSVEIVAFHGWRSLVEELGSCTLRYDRSIHPYESAGIRAEIVDIEALTPMALYVLNNRLDEVQALHDALMVQYCFGLWDLPGWIEFQYNSSDTQIIAPPIVEEYTEDMAFDTPTRIAGLVDGLHRCMAARRMGVERLWVLVASGVRYPLVPLPATWPEVQVLRKRRYRYRSLEEFPDVSEYSDVEVNERNFQYFFFRDLRELGSRGERTAHEFEGLRADQAPDL